MARAGTRTTKRSALNSWKRHILLSKIIKAVHQLPQQPVTVHPRNPTRQVRAAEQQADCVGRDDPALTSERANIPVCTCANLDSSACALEVMR
jgi:hypothetical protein